MNGEDTARLWKAFVIEDDPHDIVGVYQKCFLDYRDKFEFWWMADVQEEEDPSQRWSLSLIRSLFGADTAHATHIARVRDLFGERILTPDQGLRRGPAHGLQYPDNSEGLFNAMVDALMQHSIDLLIVDRQLTRLTKWRVPKKKYPKDPGEELCNGVDVAMRYLEEHPECWCMVLSNDGDGKKGVDEFIYREYFGNSDRWVYCDKSHVVEQVRPAMKEIAGRLGRGNRWMWYEAMAVIDDWMATPENERDSLHRYIREHYGRFSAHSHSRSIFRLCVLGLYFLEVEREERVSIGGRKLGELIGMDEVNVRTYLWRPPVGLPMTEIECFTFKENERQFIIWLLKEKDLFSGLMPEVRDRLLEV